MKIRYIIKDQVRRIENKVASQWLSGIGKDAKFAANSCGWYAIFESCPASVYLGEEEPELKAGDKVRLIVEKV
jgi:hypothetical protein